MEVALEKGSNRSLPVVNERDFLLAEVEWLEELIALTPEEDVIDRKSLEARLARVKGLLGSL